MTFGILGTLEKVLKCWSPERVWPLLLLLLLVGDILKAKIKNSTLLINRSLRLSSLAFLFSYLLLPVEKDESGENS